MKLVGLGLLLLAAIWLGQYKTARLRERATLLRQLRDFVNSVAQEIGYTARPIDQIAARLQGREAFRDCAVVASLAAGRIEAEGFALPWEEALRGAPALTPGDRELLEAFGRGLGRSDAASQVAHCRRYAQELEEALALAQREAAEKGRLYLSLSALGGAFVVIVLL